jgi:hypothetical protein
MDDQIRINDLLEKRKLDFEAASGVHQYRWSEKAICKFLRLAPGDPKTIKKLIRIAANFHWDYGLFDHGEVWGRNDTPFYLIGHTYKIWSKDSLGTLIDLSNAGLLYTIDSLSWYSLDTLCVRVYHPSVLDWPKPVPDGFDARTLLKEQRNPALPSKPFGPGGERGGENSYD